MQGENAGGCTVMLRTIRFQCAGRLNLNWTPLDVHVLYLGMFTYTDWQIQREQNSIWRLIFGNVCIT
jgi:hypothetical protein